MTNLLADSLLIQKTLQESASLNEFICRYFQALALFQLFSHHH